MYLYNEVTLKNYLESFLRKMDHPIGLILKEFSKFLIRIFLIRVTNKILNFNLEWLDFSKYWSCKKLKINFKEHKYINSYLSKSNMLHKKEVFLSKMKEMEQALTNEPRNHIHGHDFIKLLSVYNKRGLKKKQKFCDIEIIEGVLYTCLEIKTIIKEYLFQKLLKWAEN